MPGLFETGPQNQSAPTRSTWGVGARGTQLLGWDPELLARFLGKRQGHFRRMADQSRFDSALALSGMSEKDKMLARLFRNSPDVARAMMNAEERKAARDHAIAMQAALEDALSEATSSSYKGRLPIPFATPNAKPIHTPMKFSVPGFAGMGGMEMNMNPALEAEVNVMPQRAYAYIAKEDPDNPALKGALTQEQYMEQRKQAMRLRERQGKARDAEAAKRKEEEDKKAMAEKRRKSAEAYLGKSATPEELELFSVMMETEKDPNPAKIVKDIEGRREKAKEKEATSLSKLEKELEQTLHKYELAKDKEAKQSLVTGRMLASAEKQYLENKARGLEKKIAEAKAKTTTSSSKQEEPENPWYERGYAAKAKLDALDAKLASGADLTPEEYAEWKSLGGDK